MGYSKNAYAILKDAQAIVETRFTKLGLNKKNEVIRLLFEISKRDNVTPSTVLNRINSTNFNQLKKLLLKKRYPLSSLKIKEKNVYLPRIKLNKNEALGLTKKSYSPKDIFVERAVKNTSLAKRAKIYFPKAKFHIIDSLKAYLKSFGKMDICDYNLRRDKLFIVKEKFDFLKKCPCTKDAIDCGYKILNVGIGCIFDCTYCFLQEYVNTPGIILPANLNDFFKYFKKEYNGNYMRIGTGEFCDSLMLDDFTQYSTQLVKFFKKYPNVIFELKTKSSNVDNLLKCSHANNVVVGFSVNPEKMAVNNEYFAASMAQRLIAMKKCAKEGYLIAIHFDPIFLFDKWQSEYKKLVKKIFKSIKPENVAWISLGTLRFNPQTKKTIEKRFPDNDILDQELCIGYDQKLRYSYDIRKQIYQDMIEILNKECNLLPIYLCMEEKTMWKSLALSMPNWPVVKPYSCNCRSKGI